MKLVINKFGSQISVELEAKQFDNVEKLAQLAERLMPAIQSQPDTQTKSHSADLD